MRISASSVVLSAALLSALPLVAAQSTPEREPSTAFVSVIDSDGNPVTGLGPNDFLIRRAGHPGRVQSVSSADATPSVVVIPLGLSVQWLSDSRGLMRAATDAVRQHFPDARVGLMVQDGATAPTMRHVSKEADGLSADIDRFFGHQNAPLLDSLVVASQTLSREPNSRRVIITAYAGSSDLIDGLSVTRVAKAVQDSGASLWVLQVGGGLPLGAADGRVLDLVPIASGGRRVSSSLATLVPLMRQTIDLLAGQYLIAYDAPAVDGPVRIGVRRDDVTVLAPNWK
ncbi:MAG: hypothetical protein AMXMBFR57_07360 [Acidimicrobiia bacterium]